MSLEAWLSFRAGENPKPIKLICCECGKRAQGNVETRKDQNSAWEPLCDACHAEDEESPPSVKRS